MRRLALVLALGLAAGFFLHAQRGPNSVYAPFEVKALFPPETSPGQFRQVSSAELNQAAMDGWELVGIVPYIYRNEERTNAPTNPKPMVTQTYPAYFFKRLRRMPR
jgi:hypothetical protein